MERIDFEQGILALAPLAGFTDLPFRQVVKKFGADITFSEMISSNALVHNAKKTFKMLQKAGNETPYIVQIAGTNLDVVQEAVQILNDIEGIDGIDLNCGCPVPKVVSQNSGSSLLLDLPHLVRVVDTIKKYSNKPYTSLKVRLGYKEKIPQDIANAINQSGADFLSVHGRTRAGAYKAPVDYEAIGVLRASCRIPVIANGDITSYEKALEVKKITGCKSLMIGRGAIGNPWIFYQLKHNATHIDPQIKKDIVLEHFDSMIDFHGEHGVAMFRKHLHTYSKNYPQATDFRSQINTISDVARMRKVLEDFF
ncbi:MAG: tRNA-dihydrouridine synthase [Sulfurospirillum sp.]|nr:tRNA-dihydrouridine synthase [Sulfurospirillum sp.]